MAISDLRLVFLSALFGGLSVASFLFLFAGGRIRLRIGLRRSRFLAPRWQRFPGQVPVTLSSFLLGFGGGGLLLSESLGWTPAAALGGAIVAGLSLLSLVIALLSRLLGGEATPMAGDTIVGTLCHVSLPIPPQGVGAIAYHAEGKRHTMPARSATGASLPARTRVLISDLRSGVALVEEF